jgi:transposase
MKRKNIKIEIPLDLEDVEIVQVTFGAQGEVIVTVASTVEGTCCACCGREIKETHGYGRERTLRHLSILGMKTYIKIKPKRYICQDCSHHPTTTQQLPWYDPNSPSTKKYDRHILRLLINSTVHDVSQKEGLGYDAAMGVIDRCVGQQVDWTKWKELPTLGIDEIALKKGHKDFVTIVSTRSKRGEVEILAVLPGRQKDTVKEFFYSIPKRLRDTVGDVCCDMYEGFIKAAAEVFGSGVRIVADRFHVAKMYRKGVDKLRKSELKKLREELPEAEHKELKGAMWAIRKPPEELSEGERVMVKKLFDYSPSLGLAYFSACELTAIFDEALTKEESQSRLRAWAAVIKDNGLTCFDSFLTTLENRMDIIANYFVDRHNSGFVEGLNNKIKVIKRRCYGIFNVSHLYQRIVIDLVGYKALA